MNEARLTSDDAFTFASTLLHTQILYPLMDMVVGGGSSVLKQWTRSQRIRAFSEMAFEAVLLKAVKLPKYQQIAEKVLRLNKLGLCNEAIGRHLGVDGKAAAKALSWTKVKSWQYSRLTTPLIA